MLGIIPGKARQAGKPAVLFCVDCSGSMTAAMLADISAELATMARTYTVTVCEFDDRIHSVKKYSHPLSRIHGRGGTSFKPVLDARWLASLRPRPDVICIATDGFGPAPAEAPRQPCIWLITKGGKKPVPFGREIRMG